MIVRDKSRTPPVRGRPWRRHHRHRRIYAVRRQDHVHPHEVPPADEGQDIGSTLIRFALDAARERHLMVIPICPFFAAYSKRHAEVQDLLDPAWHKVLALQ